MPLPQLLQYEDNTAIRQAIRTDIGPSLLPDSVIEAFYTTAAAQVVAIDTQAGAWPAGSDEAQRDHDAAVFLAAAALVASVPQLTRESFQGYSYGIQPLDPQARAEMLRDTALGLLVQNIGSDLVTLLRSPQFQLAQGRRGDVSDQSYPGQYQLDPAGNIGG